MVPFVTEKPVVVVELREWVNKRGDTMRALRVRAQDDDPQADATELFLAPGANGHTPKEGELVMLRLAARARGWETVIAADGTRSRRNGGTAYSVRGIAAA